MLAKPKYFDGSRLTCTAIVNWIMQMHEYLQQFPSEKRTRTIATYLKGETRQWFNLTYPNPSMYPANVNLILHEIAMNYGYPELEFDDDEFVSEEECEVINLPSVTIPLDIDIQGRDNFNAIVNFNSSVNAISTFMVKERKLTTVLLSEPVKVWIEGCDEVIVSTRKVVSTSTWLTGTDWQCNELVEFYVLPVKLFNVILGTPFIDNENVRIENGNLSMGRKVDEEEEEEYNSEFSDSELEPETSESSEPELLASVSNECTATEPLAPSPIDQNPDFLAIELDNIESLAPLSNE